MNPYLKGVLYGLCVLIACNLLTASRLFFGSLYDAGHWIERNPNRFTGWVFMLLLLAVIIHIVRTNLKNARNPKDLTEEESETEANRYYP